MSLKLNSSGGGSVTVQEPTTAANRTVNLPDADTTLVGTNVAQTLTNKTIQGGAITSGTVNAGGTTPFPSSGGPTSVDFTGIPSWVKRITVMFSGISVSGTANILFQVGSTTVAATGYAGGYVYINATAANSNTSTVGILMGNRAAAASYTGAIVFTQVNGNTWVGSLNYTDATAGFGGVSTGNITLSGVLDRVRITTTNGTDTFDAGSINILYEG